MLQETESLLYLTRNAFLYLVFAIQLEEARKASTKGETEAVEIPFYLHSPDEELI